MLGKESGKGVEAQVQEPESFQVVVGKKRKSKQDEGGKKKKRTAGER